jgi:hypothetical protein
MARRTEDVPLVNWFPGASSTDQLEFFLGVQTWRADLTLISSV